MYTEHFLKYFDDNELAGLVEKAREDISTARMFAELVYAPMMMSDRPDVFVGCLSQQGERFVHDLFSRAYGLYGEEFPYSKADFAVDIFTCKPNTELFVMHLPQQDVREGNCLQIILILDSQIETSFWATVEKGEGEQRWIYTFDLDSYDWKQETVAPSNPDALVELVLGLTARKARAQYQYIPAKCPLCGRVLYLGLREEEMEGYRRYQEDGADLEDALPALNAFEREFLITGMCPDCQCDVFRKELPADTRRWALSEEK